MVACRRIIQLGSIGWCCVEMLGRMWFQVVDLDDGAVKVILVVWKLVILFLVGCCVVACAMQRICQTVILHSSCVPENIFYPSVENIMSSTTDRFG